ncbi:DUF1971 domain-containing protein [Pacificimonas sp. ICDLI1SI03]
MDSSQPYSTSPIFDEISLPTALREEHRTKAGVWGIIRALEGSLELHFEDGTPTRIVTPGEPGAILPDQPHWVQPGPSMRMQVDFYNHEPVIGSEERRLS